MGEFTPIALFFLIGVLPLVTVYQWVKKPAPRAVVFVTFFAALFAPEAAYLKLPGVPPLDKHNLPYLFLLVLAVATKRERLWRARPMRGLDLLVIVLAFSGFATMLTNAECLQFGGWAGHVEVPGLIINDGIQMFVRAFLDVYVPFLIGKAFLRTPGDLRMLFRFLTVAALIQVLLIAVEIRFSPMLHELVYGYSAHSDFLQTLRWGGYRPMGFTAHGLALAIFMLAAVMATAANARLGERFRFGRRTVRAKPLLYFLCLVLLACKSTAAILMMVVLVPLMMRGSLKWQRRFALAMAVVVIGYPMIRASQWLPVENVVETAEEAFGEERAQSLGFRFHNEEILLERAAEKPFFGWGGHGRRSVYSDEDGREISVSDGAWIITLGMQGIIGFLCTFGLIVFPVILLLRQSRRSLRTVPELRLATALALIVATLAFDLIPNGLFSRYIYVFAGACYGAAQEMRRRTRGWVPG